MLESLGLDSVSEAIYIAILAQPGICLAELAKRFDFLPKEVENAIAKLRALTLLQLRSNSNGLFAISPEHGMEILLAAQQAELASFQRRVELSRVAAAQLIAQHTKICTENETPEVEYVTGIDDIRIRLETLSAAVESEVMTFSPTKHTEADASAGKQATARYVGTGVTSKSIYQHSALQDPATVEYLKWLARNGFELRTTAALPSRMVIFDRKVAMLPMNSEDSREGAVVLYGKATVAAFCSLFDWVWERAIPVDLSPGKNDEVTAALEVEAIWLLAQGYTDETVAKRLGVSPRTSRRIVESLMRRLGARSRFQAGVFAERHGLLDQSPL
jgi:DNA-binding CsgD family transcriptional regulator